MSSVAKKITDDILGFDKNRFLGFKKKNIKNAVGKVMTPGQMKTAGKIAKVAAPVMAFTPVGKIAGAAVKKGGKGIASVAKSVGGGAGSIVGKGLSSAGSLVGKGMSGVGIVLGKTPASAITGAAKKTQAANLLKGMKSAGSVASKVGKKIPLTRGGYAMTGSNPLGQKGSMFAMTNKVAGNAKKSVRKAVKKGTFSGSSKGLVALFLDLPFL